MSAQLSRLQELGHIEGNLVPELSGRRDCSKCKSTKKDEEQPKAADLEATTVIPIKAPVTTQAKPAVETPIQEAIITG